MNQSSNTGNTIADNIATAIYIEPSPDRYGLTEADLKNVYVSNHDFSRNVSLCSITAFLACLVSYAAADKTDSFKLVSWLSLILIIGFLCVITAIVSVYKWKKNYKSFPEIMDGIKEKNRVAVYTTQSGGLPSEASTTSSSIRSDSS